MKEPEIPSEFYKLACEWYDGQGDMLYAVASTGNLTRGTQRPYNDEKDRPMTDLEWSHHLWCCLSIAVMRAKKSARKLFHSDEKALQHFEDYCDSVVAELEHEIDRVQ